MALMVRILFVILFHGFVILAADPDPVQDFCVADADSAIYIPCKNSSLVTVEDFIFSGLNAPLNFSAGVAVTPVDVNSFPGLRTQGVSFTRAVVEVGGIVEPHVHPRATEVLYVAEGKVYSAFLDTQNTVFSREIKQGEVMVYPRGLLHFLMNAGETQATLLGIYNSENPGTSTVSKALFGSEIKEEFLQKAFGLSGEEMSKVRGKLHLRGRAEVGFTSPI